MTRQQVAHFRHVRLGLLLAATVIVLTPKVDLSAAPELTAFFDVVELGQSRTS